MTRSGGPSNPGRGSFDTMPRDLRGFASDEPQERVRRGDDGALDGAAAELSTEHGGADPLYYDLRAELAAAKDDTSSEPRGVGNKKAYVPPTEVPKSAAPKKEDASPSPSDPPLSVPGERPPRAWMKTGGVIAAVALLGMLIAAMARPGEAPPEKAASLAESAGSDAQKTVPPPVVSPPPEASSAPTEPEAEPLTSATTEASPRPVPTAARSVAPRPSVQRPPTAPEAPPTPPEASAAPSPPPPLPPPLPPPVLPPAAPSSLYSPRPQY